MIAVELEELNLSEDDLKEGFFPSVCQFALSSPTIYAGVKIATGITT